MCLICGEFYCIKSCDEIISYSDRCTGNLNLHARNAHFGTSVFIDCRYATVMLVNSPRNLYHGFLYLGKLGQEIDPIHSNWEEFSLSEYNYSKIKKMVLLGSVPQEMLLQMELTGLKIEDNYL